MTDILGLVLSNLEAYSYLILFILMLIEGPIITMIGAFGAALGFFNIYYILILSLLGNVIPDILYFSIGKFMRKKSIEDFIHRMGFTRKNIYRLEKNLKEHTKKAVVFIKITPFIPIPGIMLAGFLKLPFKKFFSISIIVDIIAISIYALVGFYAGIVGINIVRYLRWEKYIVLIIVIIILITSIFTKRVYNWIVKQVKKRI